MLRLVLVLFKASRNMLNVFIKMYKTSDFLQFVCVCVHLVQSLNLHVVCLCVCLSSRAAIVYIKKN